MPKNTQSLEHGLSAGQLARYREEGYLRYGPFLNGAEMEELQQVGERMYADANLRSIELDAGEGGTYPLYTPVFSREPRFEEILFRHPVLLDILESILGPVFRLVEDQYFYKPAKHGASLACHHDNIYYGFVDPKIVTVWLALDDATLTNGCLKVLPGSHREEIEHQGVPGTIITEAVIDKNDLVSVPVPAGELILVDGLTVHGSGPNTTDAPRRVANLVAIVPCADSASRTFSLEANPYLRGAPV